MGANPSGNGTSNLNSSLRPKQSSHSRQPIKKLIERYRIITHAHASRVVDRVGNRRANPTDAEFADTFRRLELSR
jgi:t-SNARE complex subunit (syntaxin)